MFPLCPYLSLLCFLPTCTSNSLTSLFHFFGIFQNHTKSRQQVLSHGFSFTLYFSSSFYSLVLHPKDYWSHSLISDDVMCNTFVSLLNLWPRQISSGTEMIFFFEEIEYIFYCRESCRATLRSPSTAKWPFGWPSIFLGQADTLYVLGLVGAGIAGAKGIG